MATLGKPSQHPGTEFCVWSGLARIWHWEQTMRSVNRESVGRNKVKGNDSPDIERVVE
jgi:hypothetical protein